MCGIAGFFNNKTNYEGEREKWNTVLEKMNQVQKHRGPDGEGIYLKSNCGLAHVRLSIIDLISGQQPMVRMENGREYAISYNGEIYNMHMLKRKMQKEGVEFYTTSDTEVILAGYIKYGIDFVRELNGIFAFAIWDEYKKTLYLARDHVGVKPLFYTQKGSELIFSSEIKGLFVHPKCDPILDEEGLCEIFALGPAKSYGKGVFKGVNEVLPGHFLEIREKSIRDITYWKLEGKPHEDSYETTVEKTAWLLQDSVRGQMLSDIPISTFLSGGVDSSLVTAICAKELQKQGKKLRTFSFDFEGNETYFKASRFQPTQDRYWVDEMVKYSKTNHIYLECNNEKLEEFLYKAVDARDLPCMADVESSLLYFCTKVEPYNKVTLTGECADEIFGGYPWFHRREDFECDAFPWSKTMEMRKILLKDEWIEKLPLEDYSHAAYKKTIDETPVLYGESKQEARRREISYLNMRWFMTTLLDRMDRTSMHTGLEARVPIADYRIVEYVFNVPWEMKCKNQIVKGLLREAGKSYLPMEVLYRKKSPYPKTYHPQYEKMLGQQLMKVLEKKDAPIHQFLDEKKVRQFIESPSDYGKPWYGQLMAGPQLLAFMLQINYWLTAYKIQIVN